MSTKEGAQLKYRILRIYTAQFSFEDIDEKEVNKLAGALGSVNVKMKLGLKVDAKTSEILISISTDWIKTADQVKLFNHTGNTLFHIENLNDILDEESKEYLFPNPFLIQIQSLAYSHARALLAIEISPTVYKDKFFLPIVKIADIVNNTLQAE